MKVAVCFFIIFTQTSALKQYCVWDKSLLLKTEKNEFTGKFSRFIETKLLFSAQETGFFKLFHAYFFGLFLWPKLIQRSFKSLRIASFSSPVHVLFICLN